MTAEVIEVKMSWKEAAVVIAAALEDGTGKGKQMAREELMRMADAADHAVGMQAELRRAQAELEAK